MQIHPAHHLRLWAPLELFNASWRRCWLVIPAITEGKLGRRKRSLPIICTTSQRETATFLMTWFMCVAQKRIVKGRPFPLPPPSNLSHRLSPSQTNLLWTVEQQRRQSLNLRYTEQLYSERDVRSRKMGIDKLWQNFSPLSKKGFSKQDLFFRFTRERTHRYSTHTPTHTDTPNIAWTCKSSYTCVNSWAQTHNDTYISIQPTNRRIAFGTKLQIPNLFLGKSHRSAHHIIHNEKLIKAPSPSPPKKKEEWKKEV